MINESAARINQGDNHMSKLEDTVRVTRIVEYVGLRSLVEEQVKGSIHGTKVVSKGRLTIRATTLGEYPDIIVSAGEKPRVYKDIKGRDILTGDNVEYRIRMEDYEEMYSTYKSTGYIGETNTGAQFISLHFPFHTFHDDRGKMDEEMIFAHIDGKIPLNIRTCCNVRVL